MTKLTADQEAFLKHHDIALSAVFDATGMRKKDYQEEMKLLEKSIAIGVTPCGAAGHTMRTRAGHCAQCNPAAIQFQKRYEMTACIYVAGSQSRKFLKIGFSEQPDSRERILNTLRYGGATDWKLLFFIECAQAGAIEHKIQSKLQKYAADGSYEREYEIVNCFELFACSYRMAKEAIETVLDADILSRHWERNDAAVLYDFEPIVDSGFVRLGNPKE